MVPVYQLVSKNSRDLHFNRMFKSSIEKISFTKKKKQQTNIADGVERLRLLAVLRDETIENYEKRHTKPAYGAMCREDLNLLKEWQYNWCVKL